MNFTELIVGVAVGASMPLVWFAVRVELQRAHKRRFCAWCAKPLIKGGSKKGVCMTCLLSTEDEGAAAPEGWPRA